MYLERGTAQRCAQRCAEFAGQLRQIQVNAQGLGLIDGFGYLPSGIALAAKFKQKAVDGDYSMDQALADHIAVVQEMQRVFEKIEAMYAASDDSGARGISVSGAAL
ncbi:hypothetical protein SAMN05444583_10879 [Rhodococcus maanshanensis]|uniref:Excreted virulence factor EspC, type VII ESX diderm n=1 Tax=Rhodococcus maanshanensis TaxID=183556 RepID=A0A1H7PJY5_9NOCA|nr:hypothetical protein SAMN05444583_10879 [Rhodococcus maanshanensis]